MFIYPIQRAVCNCLMCVLFIVCFCVFYVLCMCV